MCIRDRNLLLAGLAVAAMTACSNNDEIVENGIQTTGEEASMQINLKFADQGTRAVSGEPDEGADFERESSTVTAIIVYPNSTKNKVYKNLTLVEGSNKTYKTEAFSVEAANGVNVYAIINYDADKANALAATANLTELTVGAQSLPDKGLAYIAETVAKENAFLMSGSTAEPIDIEAGSTTNVAPITVDRVAAKLDELTNLSEAFTIENGDKIYNTTGKAVSVKLEGFSFSNLSSDSYIFGGKTSASSWLQQYIPATGTATDATYRWITEGVTYCLENNTIANPTRVHYKGQVCLDETPINEDFFIRAITFDGVTTYRLFTTWDALTTYYDNAAITALDPSKPADLAKYGIMKYLGGICYYEADIKTYSPTESTSVLRNNWYQLTVNKITKIGLPTPAPEPTPDATMLTIETTVKPWTIQVNGYDL